MRRRLLLGLVPAIPAAAVLFGACETRPVRLGLALTFPQGLLDQATSVTLSVYGSPPAACDAQTGQVTAASASAQVFPLQQTGCASGDLWCTTLTLPEDGSTKVFSVVASRAGATLATGCATQSIDQDPVVVDIKALRYAPAACCNDGLVEPGEQCDNARAGTCMAGGEVGACSGIVEDTVCHCDCTSKEILLSLPDATTPGLKNLPAGSKSDLTLSFGPGGSANAEILRAVYESDDTTAGSGIDLHASFLGADLYPLTDPYPLSLQLQFPVQCNAVETTTGQLLDQRYPAIARAAEDTVVVVYQSNQVGLGMKWDVFLNPQLAEGCTDTKPCTKDSDCQTTCDPASKTCAVAVQLDTLGFGATDPHVSGGPAGTVLVTWTRSDGVYGRIWRTDGTIVPATGEIQIAPSGSAARVAGNLAGFQVV